MENPGNPAAEMGLLVTTDGFLKLQTNSIKKKIKSKLKDRFKASIVAWSSYSESLYRRKIKEELLPLSQ